MRIKKIYGFGNWTNMDIILIKEKPALDLQIISYVGDYLDDIQKRCILGVGGHIFFVSTKIGFLVSVFTFHLINNDLR